MFKKPAAPRSQRVSAHLLCLACVTLLLPWRAMAATVNTPLISISFPEDYSPAPVIAFTVTSSDPGLIVEAVQISGTLLPVTLFPITHVSGIDYTVTLNPQANDFGNAVIELRGSDTNGVGTDSFTMTVNPVNDPPSFTTGPDQAVVDCSGTHTVTGWATAISAGPYESAQSLGFTLANDAPSLFLVQPSLQTNGTLSYTVAPDANGVAHVDIELKDNGGGDDTATAQFTITVTRAGRLEPNGTQSTAVTLGSGPSITERDLFIGGALDEDWYKITANQTGLLIVDLLFEHAAGDLDFAMHDGLGAIMATATSVSDNEQIIIPVAALEDYYVRVFGVGGATNTYDLTTLNAPAPAPDDATLDPLDDTGASDADGITSDSAARLFISVDLSDFAALGIDILTPAEVAAGEPGAAVEVIVNGAPVGFATLIAGSNNSVFEYTFSPGELSTTFIPVGGGGGANLVAAGVRVFDAQVAQADGRGEVSDPLVITLDGTAPAAPSTPDLLSASDDGISSTDNVTSHRSPAFDGTGEPNATVRLFANGLQVAEGAVSVAGTWRLTSSQLANGVYDMTARLEDAAGNVSPMSSVLQVEVDSVIPLVPTIRLIDNYTMSSCGICNSIGQPNLDFEVEGTAGDIVDILDGVTVIDSYTSTGKQVRVELFGTGWHFVSARARDAAGHISAQTAPITFFTDVTPPAIVPPPNQTVECGAPTGTNAMGVATATDECSHGIVIGWSDNQVPGSSAGNYVVNRNWTATDMCGNGTNETQVITVEDTIAPTIACDDIVLLGDLNCVAALPDITGHAVTFDACGSVTVTQDPAAGTNLFGPGDFLVTLSASDGANTSQCPVNVTVRYRTFNDYDGDGRSDLAVYDPDTGNWSIQTMAGVNLATDRNWGFPGAHPVPGDYDGDGIYDLAVYDPVTGNWFIQAMDGSYLAWLRNWGFPGAHPVPGDYDGDGIYDLAVHDPVTGNWFIQAMDGSYLAWLRNWGATGGNAVPGDYDGDGIYDLAVYDPVTGNWSIQTMAGVNLATDRNWGFPGAYLVPGDYDGDRISDLAVHDPVTGNWFIQAMDGSYLAWLRNWGFPGAHPVPGDYDGDGIYDLAVYDSVTGNWFIQAMDGAYLAWFRNWGATGFVPIGGQY